MRLSFFLLFVLIAGFVTAQDIRPGAERTELYVPMIQSKKVAVVCNLSSVVGEKHLVDMLREKGVQVTTIFAPEHGFRANADAGAHVKSGVDSETGIPVKSLYGDSKKPRKEDFQDIDIVIFDIQDVGCRFYTYISTLEYMMDACADFGVNMILLDRPNPNGHYVDGPVLDKKYRSFVGMQSVPVVYGMTMGEYAQMLKGERWLSSKTILDLSIIPCENYSHRSLVRLQISPSPNLKSSQAIALYPSLCLMEGTDISVGRGTDRPFEMYGSPYLDSTVMPFRFIPTSKVGATNPPFKNQTCFGMDLGFEKVSSKFNLSYLLKAYQSWKKDKSSFFLKNLFFDKLAGNASLRTQIIAGKSETEIRKSWEPSLRAFKKIRKKYLLYADFE